MSITYDGIVSQAEYLKVEESAREKSEYVAGRIFTMSGATVAHNRIVMNLSRNLFDAATQSGCDIFASDMKLKIDSLRSFYYPDLMVTCEHMENSTVFATAPCLIVEVLSPSTITVDRREKLLAYRSIPSLKEYVLVHQNKRRIELCRKDGDSDWEMHEFENSDTVSLLSLPCGELNLNIEDVYRGITFVD